MERCGRQPEIQMERQRLITALLNTKISGCLLSPIRQPENTMAAHRTRRAHLASPAPMAAGSSQERKRARLCDLRRQNAARNRATAAAKPCRPAPHLRLGRCQNCQIWASDFGCVSAVERAGSGRLRQPENLFLLFRLPQYRQHANAQRISDCLMPQKAA